MASFYEKGTLSASFHDARGDMDEAPFAAPHEYLPPEKLRAARLAVAGRATDLEDARLLLGALGLIPTNSTEDSHG